MKGKSLSYDHNMTLLKIETTVETPRLYRYKEVWKRALQKLKFDQIIRRFMNISRNNPFTVTQEILDTYVEETVHKSSNISANYILLQHGSIYLAWQFVLLLSLTYTITFGMFYSAFVDYSPTSLLIEVEILIDLIYLLDILVTMNISVYDINNRLVTKRREIIIHYAKGRLLLDVYSAVPLSMILKSRTDLKNNLVMIFRLIPKMLKIIGFGKKLENFSFVKKIGHFVIKHKNIIGILGIGLKFLVALHIYACLLFLTSRYKNFDSRTWVFNENLLDESISFQYTTSLYFAFVSISTLGYGDITPSTQIEIGLVMIWMAVGILITSVLVSEFISLLNKVFEMDSIVDKNISIFEEISRYMNLNKLTKTKLKKFIKDEKIINLKLNFYTVLQKLDSSLRFEIATDIYNKGITKIPYFSMKKQEFLSFFTFLLEYVRYDKDEFIWHKHSFTDGIYFIIEGSVKFLYKDILFFVVYEGGFFGDFEVFLKTERKFDVEVAYVCKCFKMGNNALRVLKKEFPDYYEELKDMNKVRKQNMLSGLAQMYSIHLYKMGLLDSICKEQIENVKLTCLNEFLYEKIKVRKYKFKGIAHDLKAIESHKKKVKNLLSNLLADH